MELLLTMLGVILVIILSLFIFGVALAMGVIGWILKGIKEIFSSESSKR